MGDFPKCQRIRKACNQSRFRPVAGIETRTSSPEGKLFSGVGERRIAHPSPSKLQCTLVQSDLCFHVSMIFCKFSETHLTKVINDNINGKGKEVEVPYCTLKTNRWSELCFPTSILSTLSNTLSNSAAQTAPWGLDFRILKR